GVLALDDELEPLVLGRLEPRGDAGVGVFGLDELLALEGVLEAGVLEDGSLSIAPHVSGPTIPLALQPCEACKPLTAACVCGPYIPSTGWIPSCCWIRLTASPVEPSEQ